MAKPTNSIANIKMPGENTQRPIVPYAIAVGGSNVYQATLPTLSGDTQLVTTSENHTIDGLITFTNDNSFTGENTFSGCNHFTQETEFTHEEYCPDWIDIGSGIGKSSLFTRGAFMQAIIGQILTANDEYYDEDTGYNIEEGKLKIERITDTEDGQPVYTTIAEFSEDGLDLKGGDLILSSSGKLSNGTYTFALPTVTANKTLGLQIDIDDLTEL